jgi:hypothetical protein
MKKIYKLSNYDYSLLYNNIYAINYTVDTSGNIDYQNIENYHVDNTLFKNIYKTIFCCIYLLDDKDYKKFIKILNSEEILFYYNKTECSSEKYLRSYFKRYYEFTSLIERCNNDIFIYLNELWIKIYNKRFFDI